MVPKLLSQALVAIDGSEFKALNTRDKNFTAGKIDKRQQQIQESIHRYLGGLDTAESRHNVFAASPTKDPWMRELHLIFVERLGRRFSRAGKSSTAIQPYTQARQLVDPGSRLDLAWLVADVRT